MERCLLKKPSDKKPSVVYLITTTVALLLTIVIFIRVWTLPPKLEVNTPKRNDDVFNTFKYTLKLTNFSKSHKIFAFIKDENDSILKEEEIDVNFISNKITGGINVKKIKNGEKIYLNFEIKENEKVVFYTNPSIELMKKDSH